jgi:alkylation response protein AidB-like acyl-CoA dehydrogenase
MRQSGVEVRPLTEMTGSAMFCEVFFTDAAVGDADRIGDTNDGWRVAQTTLMVERSGMGAGSDAPRGSVMARPGTVAGDLDKRAGDFVRSRTSGRPSEGAASTTSFIDLARRYRKHNDALVRQDLVRLYIWRELARLNVERHKAVRESGGDIPGLANFSKLAMGHVVRLQRDLGLRILGSRGMLHAYDEAGRTTLAPDPAFALAQPITYQALGAQALPIFGGTDQIQRNIISERALGLPKEPGDLSKVPFDQLPRNG